MIPRTPLSHTVLANVIVLILVLGSIILAFKEDHTNLEILAYQVPGTASKDSPLVLRGRVLSKGDPIQGATVWTELKDDQSQRYSVDAMHPTDSNGTFEVSNVPKFLGESKITHMIVYAKHTQNGHMLRGSEALSVAGKEAGCRTLNAPVWRFAGLPIIFLLGIFVAFWGPSPKWQYYSSIILTVLFAASMIAAIAIGIKYVTSTDGKRGEELCFGPISIFKGTYMKDVEKDWLFSLTAPTMTRRDDAAVPAKATGVANQETSRPTGSKSEDKVTSAGTATERQNISSEVITGFGVPFWTLFLSVLGASILTVSMIVNEIKGPPDFAEAGDVNKRLESFVRHQFSVLFAPFASIVVYQLWIAGVKPQEYISVALVSIGAGASLDYLLKQAVDKAQKLFGGTPNVASESRDLQAKGGAKSAQVQESGVNNTAKADGTVQSSGGSAGTTQPTKTVSPESVTSGDKTPSTNTRVV